MKHKNAEMIKAKVDNMELVVFYRLQNEEWWQPESDHATLPDDIDFDYFLCLPQYKEACLHWLNGGRVVCNVHGLGLRIIETNDWTKRWEYKHAFNMPSHSFTIKPKKEKRWMIYSERPLSIEIFSDESVCDTVFSSKLPTENKQKIEIEVEV